VTGPWARKYAAALGLDVVAPVVVESVLVVIRHPARGEFPAVVELQVRDARRILPGG
jgi:hypothetical protein